MFGIKYFVHVFTRCRGQAMCAMGDGNLDEALKLFGEAIELNPHAAVLFAKRSQLLVIVDI